MRAGRDTGQGQRNRFAENLCDSETVRRRLAGTTFTAICTSLRDAE
jgi:hypothetical protein